MKKIKLFSVFLLASMLVLGGCDFIENAIPGKEDNTQNNTPSNGDNQNNEDENGSGEETDPNQGDNNQNPNSDNNESNDNNGGTDNNNTQDPVDNNGSENNETPNEDPVNNGGQDNNSGDSSGSNNENNNNENNNENSNENQGYTLKNPDYSTNPTRNSFDELTTDDLFNLHNKVEINVRVSNEELNKIVSDNNLGPKPDIYRYASYMSLSITNKGVKYTEQFSDIGIRQKGNTSREAIFVDNHLNSHNHYKLSFDEKFNDVDIYGQDFVDLHGDKKRGDREILSLSGLDIKWDRNTDNTHMREIYTSMLFRSAGIIAQRVGLATFTIITDTETVPFGLCYIYEQASKSLIKHSLESGDSYIGMSSWSVEKKGEHGVAGAKYGDLYKATYGTGAGANSGGDLTLSSISGQRVGVRTELYGNLIPAYERKTNKDDPSDEQFKNIISVLASGTYADIEQVIDLDYFAVEEAVAFFAGNPDSMRYNYNNYEFYIRRTDGKMVFIPIDGDRNFGIGNTWSDGLSFVRNSSRTPLDKKDVQGNNCRNPLFNKTILSSSNNACKDLYLDYIAKIAQSDWVKEETFEAFYNVAKTTYNGEATFSLNANGDNITFSSFISTKLAQAGFQTNSNENNNNQNQNTSVVNDPDNMYLVGTFNGWGSYSQDQLSYYKLNKVNDSSVYTCSITITNNNSDEPNNFIKLKINSGFANYSPNNYTFEVNNSVYTIVDGNNRSSFRLDGYGVGSTLTVTVNVSTGIVTFSN